MMKKTLLFALTGILTLILFFACRKSDEIGQPAPVPVIDQPDSLVSASLQGRVTDENGAPLKGVQISSGLSSTTTDVNGVFNMGSVTLSKLYGFVKAQKEGYFTGSRTIFTNAQKINYVEIQLLPRTV